MGYFSCELFEKELEKMNYIQVAEWIIACREVVKKEDFNTYEEYIQALELFCLEWEEHYKLNKDFYTSDKYKKALAYIVYKERVKFVLNYGSGKEEFTMKNYQSMPVNFVERAIKEAEKSFSSNYSEILAIFKNENKEKYKELLHQVISKQYFKTIDVIMKIFKNGKLVKTSTYKEFLEFCQNEKNYVIEVQQRKRAKNYNEALESFDIPKTLYNEFISFNLCEKEFDKKMFVNLAFALALTFSNAEKLLNYNGYTLNSVERQFDVVCSKAFKIGFSREMVIALIDKRNEELKEKNMKYNLIPNITKNIKNK